MDAFSGCSSLKSVTIPPSISSIEYSYRAFSGCTSLETAILNPSSDTIPSSFFLGCSSLKSVTFSDNIIRISGNAFEGCSSLNTISLPSRIQYIGYRSFAGCSSVTSVDIPSTILGISQGAFSNCSKLESINIKGTNTSFVSRGGVLFTGKTLLQYPCGKGDNYEIPNDVDTLEEYSFAGCTGLTTVTIPPNVQKIKDSCFEGCGLRSITIPKTVTKYGYHIFKECPNLESVVLESTLDILSSFFTGCSKLKYVSIPQGVKYISSHAFEDCTSLSNLTLPSSINFVDNQAFEGCISLTYIKYEGKTDPCRESSYSNHFSTCTSLDIVCVPLDYDASEFCHAPICKTTHCEQEVSKYNQCYELVKCGEPDAEVRIRANTTQWIQQTDGCVEYRCDNRTGRISWSNCNSTKCIEGICESTRPIQQTENLTVDLTVDMPVHEWNMSEVVQTFVDLSKTQSEETKVGLKVNDEGTVVQIFLMINAPEGAGVVETVATQCSHDPDTPVIYDDMCDEFNCTGFMHNIKKVRVVVNDGAEFIMIEQAHLNHGNQLLLYLAIFLMIIAAYLV